MTNNIHHLYKILTKKPKEKYLFPPSDAKETFLSDYYGKYGWTPPDIPDPCGYCPHCGQDVQTIEWRRTNSQYIDDRSNWVLCCAGCHGDIEEEYAERWEEYYSGRL